MMISALSLATTLFTVQLPESWNISAALPETAHNSFLVQAWSVFEQAFEVKRWILQQRCPGFHDEEALLWFCVTEQALHLLDYSEYPVFYSVLTLSLEKAGGNLQTWSWPGINLSMEYSSRSLFALSRDFLEDAKSADASILLERQGPQFYLLNWRERHFDYVGSVTKLNQGYQVLKVKMQRNAPF